MTIPETLLRSLEGLPGFDRTAFVQAHDTAALTSVRFNPLKYDTAPDHYLPIDNAVPWSRYGYYLSSRPSFTFDPLFHAGCYYVQEASSMFLEQAFVQHAPAGPVRVLDLCGAPGGKSTHIRSLIGNESLLVSNEVIRSRSHVLADNIIKWGASNVAVTSNDPSAFEKLPGFFDVMVVDAPCSGSGLFRRDADALNEWSVNNVQLCHQRQQRILADALPALKEGGLLVYSTCSYSPEEDEQIADWLQSNWGMESLALQIDPSWGIVETHAAGGAPGYRFYPHRLRGEGFFMACFRKTSTERASRLRGAPLEKANAKEHAVITPWLSEKDALLLRGPQGFFAWPETYASDLAILSEALYIRYAGTAVGAIMKDKLVPEHALALSLLLSPGIPGTELDEAQAIRYLQRQDIDLTTENKGWQAVSFRGHRLGWINALHNRINNYYPKELRILKQRNDTGFEK